jgi:hypothetical protein
MARNFRYSIKAMILRVASPVQLVRVVVEEGPQLMKGANKAVGFAPGKTFIV